MFVFIINDTFQFYTSVILLKCLKIALFTGDFNALTSVQPICVSLLACCILGESIGQCQIISLITSVVSILLITRPPAIFGDLAMTDHKQEYFVGISFCMLGIFCQAVGYIFTRFLQV